MQSRKRGNWSYIFNRSIYITNNHIVMNMFLYIYLCVIFKKFLEVSKCEWFLVKKICKITNVVRGRPTFLFRLLCCTADLEMPLNNINLKFKNLHISPRCIILSVKSKIHNGNISYHNTNTRSHQWTFHNRSCHILHRYQYSTNI